MPTCLLQDLLPSKRKDSEAPAGSPNAKALNSIPRNLGSEPSTTQITLSIDFLGLGVGPFFIAALCEMDGRRNVWVDGNFWYILWNSLCPVGKSKALVIIPLCYRSGCWCNNMYHAKDRGKFLAIASFLTYLGPALDSLVGGVVIVQLVTWSWLFWVVGIFDALISLVLGLNFGLDTFMLSTFANLRIDPYNQSALIGSLHNIFFPIDFCLSEQIRGRIRRGAAQVAGAVHDPGGPLLVREVCAKPGDPNRGRPGALVFACWSSVVAQSMLAYTLDLFGDLGVSVNATTRLLSDVLGFVFPISALQLYTRLDYS
ncbi:hypothetical protein GGR52DRAFT_571871 [Hypoxylon sp. FL1284]|nr:hypothetical protein GGR52DRAFT_571871 [Hypoxylon sp. FL1284]